MGAPPPSRSTSAAAPSCGAVGQAVPAVKAGEAPANGVGPRARPAALNARLTPNADHRGHGCRANWCGSGCAVSGGRRPGEWHVIDADMKTGAGSAATSWRATSLSQPMRESYFAPAASHTRLRLLPFLGSPCPWRCPFPTDGGVCGFIGHVVHRCCAARVPCLCTHTLLAVVFQHQLICGAVSSRFGVQKLAGCAPYRQSPPRPSPYPSHLFTLAPYHLWGRTRHTSSKHLIASIPTLLSTITCWGPRARGPLLVPDRWKGPENATDGVFKEVANEARLPLDALGRPLRLPCYRAPPTLTPSHLKIVAHSPVAMATRPTHFQGVVSLERGHQRIELVCAQLRWAVLVGRAARAECIHFLGGVGGNHHDIYRAVARHVPLGAGAVRGVGGSRFHKQEAMQLATIIASIHRSRLASRSFECISRLASRNSA